MVYDALYDADEKKCLGPISTIGADKYIWSYIGKKWQFNLCGKS